MVRAFVESALFVRQCEAVFSPRELWSLQNVLLANPQAGVVIPGTRGLRKIRWGARGSGKRGGARVIYFWASSEGVVHFLAAYDKRSGAELGIAELRRLRETLDTQ